MRTVLIKTWCSLYGLLMLTSVYGQDILTNYIQEGLNNNLTLSQKNLSLDKAMNALEVAKSMYLPTINFDATYSHARGGRSIALPIGDLLNPVYNTLNQLTQSQLFPQIDNENINFMPQHYYDAKVHAVMPVINTDIKRNREVNEKLVMLKDQEIDIYKRELVKDIKKAYYNYLSAGAAVEVYENSLILAKESKRTNQKLLEAGSGLHAHVVRADAEISQVEAKLTEAESQRRNAQFYFNSLLNREADEAIRAVDIGDIKQGGGKESTSIREELNALRQQVEIQETILDMNKKAFIPKLNAFFDVGSQAEYLRFNKDSPYFMFGAQLTFPIFEGNRNRLKIKESQIAVMEAINQQHVVEQQLDLAVRIAENEVVSTFQNLESARKQVVAADTYHRLIQRGFNEGVNTYIETVDARSQLTTAKLTENLAMFKWLSAHAQLEREAATYSLD